MNAEWHLFAVYTDSDVARSLGFGAVYLISSQQEFYEKFGFVKFVQTVTLSGSVEAVYKKRIQ